ncbi:MAG: 2'-5' RNA ligase family protein [Armatimonadetes bacterium]|nr:2'-5' RNA ligase family protein [Anaerolineae bacterium]
MRQMVISYPTLDPQDLQWMLHLREQYPALLNNGIPPHFTLVFPLGDAEIAPAALREHVRAVTVNQRAIPFAIRCAVPYKDPSSPYTFVFLVPDEGFSQVVRLHDRLYSGLLAAHLRLEIPFTPHITLGYSSNMPYCKAVADIINTEPLEIIGSIKTLDVLHENDNHLRSVDQVMLRQARG